MPEMDAWKGFRHDPPPPSPPSYMPAFPRFTEADVMREALTLDRLAELTDDLADPLAAAATLFGSGVTEPLAPEERNVLLFAAQGLTDTVAGRHIGTCARTYRRRLVAVSTKLGARNRAHAAAIAVALGIIAADDLRPRWPVASRAPDAPGRAGEAQEG